MAERKAKAKEHAGKKLKFIPGSEPTSKHVATDYDDDIKRFAESEVESLEIPDPNDKMLSNLRSRVIALKKAKKVENVKVVSRTKKGKLTELWLAKK